MSITFAHRTQAREFARKFPLGSDMRRGLEAAGYADGFPESYTPQAVHASRRLILCAAKAENYSEVIQPLTEVLVLRDSEQWYR